MKDFDRYLLLTKVFNHMVENNCTIRELSDKFKIPKSTLHSWIYKDLEVYDSELYNKVLDVIVVNKSLRYYRGIYNLHRKLNHNVDSSNPSFGLISDK